jgi:hypothetical protein
MSDCLMDSLSDCSIAPNIQNKLFDPKAVTVSFNNSTLQRQKTLAISNKELNDDLLEYLVISTVCETYLIHTLDVRIGRISTDELLNICGRIKAIIRDCGPPPDLVVGIDLTQVMIESRNNKITRLQILKNSLNLNEIENVALTCGPDIFFETLMINLKNEVVSHQSFMRKKKFEKIEHLKKELLVLKSDYIVNEKASLKRNNN